MTDNKLAERLAEAKTFAELHAVRIEAKAVRAMCLRKGWDEVADLADKIRLNAELRISKMLMAGDIYADPN